MDTPPGRLLSSRRPGQVCRGNCIVGLDLSLRCSAAVALPQGFAASHPLDWAAVATTTTGASLGRSATLGERCSRIRSSVAHLVAFVVAHQPRQVWVEEMAFAQAGAGAREVGGLTWAVHVALDDLGADVRTVPASAARKVLLGACPRKDAKKVVAAQLAALGCPWASPDLCDAFAVANFGLAASGGRAVMFAAPAV